MDFYEVLDNVIDFLRNRGRVTYRALKRQFHLDDEFLEDLKDEIIKAQRGRRTAHDAGKANRAYPDAGRDLPGDDSALLTESVTAL